MSPTTGETPTTVQQPSTLSAQQAAAVGELVAAAPTADGASPLSEQARLALRPSGAPAPVRHLLQAAPDGALAGYAQLAGAAPTTLELVVHPAQRRRGLGAELLAAAAGAAAGEDLAAWAHGDAPAARALAARSGWRPVRELWRMELDLATHPEAAGPARPPQGVALRPFERGRDEEAWLDLNAAAFASHPEQGRWGPSDLAAREAEPWFSPAGLLLLVDAATGELLASHWTKVEDAASGIGEVYVVAVRPDAQGRGLGRVALAAGLHHLAGLGVRTVELYVDADNLAAVALYRRIGFAGAGTDVQFSPATGR